MLQVGFGERNGRFYVSVRGGDGGVTMLRVHPRTGEVVDVSGADVIDSDVAIVVNTLREQGYRQVAGLVRSWWRYR